MDQVTNTRNEFILGLSLSELAFLYFMLLLLIALFMIKDHERKIVKKEETIKEQVRVIEGLKRTDFEPGTWLVDIKKLKEGNYVLREENEKLKEENEKLKKLKFENEELERYSKIPSELKLDGLDDEKFEAKFLNFRFREKV